MPPRNLENALTPRNPHHTIVPRPSHFLHPVSTSFFSLNIRRLTFLCQKQPIALLQGDPMSCNTPSVSFSHFPYRWTEKVASLEYLSSGLNRAGCADLVTSPAWTCRISKMLAKADVLYDGTPQTLLRVYNRFPLASNVYMRCILDEML